MAKVAIVGFACRFPQTNSQNYWDDLLNGRDLVTKVEAGRWAQEAFLHPNKSHPGSAYTFAAGSLGDVSGFDAEFFGISPREAAFMDPQQRLLLEMSWEALENAGIKPSSLRGSACGVFIGIASADYSYRIAEDLAAIDAPMATGNTASIAANRLSYFFDLRGPSMAIDTACSSSLVAFHQACRSIQSGETTHALAGGISLHLHPYGFITFSKASMLSRQGRCRVFDAAGDGYVRSEGGGVFVLKDYDLALADGDPILAVVAHSGVNTDGRKSGLTVPNRSAQVALLRDTYAQAGIAPAEIDYIEAHGTGTAVGDPIETASLGEALGQRRPPGKPLLIGSVKSNLGHLEAASGVAGLAKALHCLRYRLVPATIGIQSLNPKIPLGEWNLEVATQNRPLPAQGRLVIGVNSFGFGGANAHVILQSPETTQPVTAALPAAEPPLPVPVPLVLSANSEAGLQAQALAFADHLHGLSAQAVYASAYTAAFHRDWLRHRVVVFGDSTETLTANLRQYASGNGGSSATAVDNASAPAFIYDGNGSQWEGMGRTLLADPVFHAAVAEVDALFVPLAGYSLLKELAGDNGSDRYARTEIAQPALFALQVGITAMLRHLGVHPCAVAGHSVGEVAAAWASGALPLASAVRVIYQRSRLQGRTKGSGQMTAVGLDAAAMQTLLQELQLQSLLCLSGINSPSGVTIAGDVAALAQLEQALASRGGVFYRRLDLDYAFHSPAMDSIKADILASLSKLGTTANSIPFYSTVTGDRLDGKTLRAEYWWQNVRKPVLFADAINHIQAAGGTVFIEIGPHPVLRSYLNDCLKHANLSGRAIATVQRGNDSPQQVQNAAGLAIACGATVEWTRLFPTVTERVALPNYPWQRERHWHPLTAESQASLNRHRIHPLLGYAVPRAELIWENTLDTQTHPSLADHVVGEATVFAGAGFVELGLAAALAWHPGETAEIEELEIPRSLLLGAEHSKLLRVQIDSQDGSFSVKAREQLANEALAVYASGRILREPSGILLRMAAPALPTRRPDFDRASHETLTLALGLTYGPVYQAMAYGWVEGQTALAVFEPAASLAAELDSHFLHPALLDSAFQLIIQILKDERANHDGSTFVPASVGRIAFRHGLGAPHLARAVLRRRSPHSLLADFALFDADGRPIACINAMRFRSMRLSKGRAQPLRHLECRSIPKPHPLAPAQATPVLPFSQTVQTMKEAVRRCVLKGTHRRYSEEVDPLLDSLCSRWFQSAPELLRAVRGSHPSAAIAPYQKHLLMLAQEDGLLEADGDWKLPPLHESQATAQDIWNSLVADYPDYFKIIHAVGRIGLHLRPLLEGNLPVQDVHPHDASFSTLSRQVLGANGRHAVGEALRELVQRGLDRLPEGQRLGVLEICAGPPLFALDICPVLDFDQSDYVFASTHAQSVEEARHVQEKFPAISALAISSTDSAIPPRSFQLAVVSVDFMDARDAVRALEYAQARLAPGASLLVLGQHPARWVDFVFGAQAGWWPTNGSSGARQRPARFWQAQMEQMGFGPASLLEFSPDTASGPYLLIGQFSAPTAAALAPSISNGHWLILADGQGYSAALAERLRKKLAERGCPAQLAPVETAADIERLVTQAQANARLEGIVHLAGLDRGSPGADPGRRLRHSVDRCLAAAAIVKACETAQVGTACWIVTAGAMTDMLPKRKPAGWRASVFSLDDSALWGFVRTLANESASVPLRLVDLEDPYSLEAAAAALDLEFAQTTAEQEILITANGGRFVPRLRPKPRQIDHESTAASKTSVLRLGFHAPGQLRHLRWEEHARVLPGHGELEIEVQATGLNFRDVMYALGMLADEAIENGFAGPSLGLEFAGIVRTVGAQTKGFSPGDRVVGFGPSSFSNKVVTQASAVAPIPPGISVEAAATIPSAFFTVYYALHHLARVGKGEKVLIHGAAGGVGIAAIQVAKWCGAEIFATAGSDEKRDVLRLLGVEHIYDSRSLAFADQILADTGGTGVDVVLNSLAGEAVNRNLRVLKPFGRFLELGKRDFYENNKIGLRPFRNNISYFGIDADQLMSERPQFTGQLFSEMMGLFNDNVLYPLPYQAFEAEDVVDAFRYMQQSKQIGKIIVTYRHGISSFRPNERHLPKRLEFSANASYLVTGGLSGFGLKTAQWLVAKGARQLVLVSRRGLAGDEARQAVAAMVAAGAKVLAVACDVADKAQLQNLLAEIAQRLPPLRGVFHAAMVVDDALIRNMDAGQIQRVFAPKILGAQNLHDLTLREKLDYFVLYSSATTLFGNPGQSNYVAANTWLEALARHRQGLGLPATCVLWGAIGDTGFLARHDKAKDALLHRMGGAAMDSAEALQTLEWLLVNKRSDEGVLDFEWKALSRFLPKSDTPKFSELARHASEDESDDSHAEDIQRLLAELPDETLLEIFTDILKQEVGEILRISTDKIDANRSLNVMGLDSLMGVELVGALESRFGVKLPVMSLSEAQTIDRLARRILTQLRNSGDSDADATSAESSILRQVQHAVTQHAAEVSPDAAARFAEDIHARDHIPNDRIIPS